MITQLQYATRDGDQTISWNHDDEESLKTAEIKIQTLADEGYRFFIDGDRHDDPTTIVRQRVQSIVAVAPMAGG